MTNVLFLGGNRYFGRLVLHKLLKKNYNIYLINRNSKKEKIQNKNLIHICCDRGKLDKIKNLFDNVTFDYVFDNIAYKLKDVKTLHKLLHGKIGHYIFTSTVMTYLNLNDGYEVKEQDWFKNKNTKNMLNKYQSGEIKYALNKEKIERYLLKNKNINSTILRVASVIGKNDFSKKTKKLLTYSYRKINDSNLSGNDYIQFCFKEDLVRVIVKIIEKKNKQTDFYNVANKKIKIKDFFKKLNRLEKFSTKRKKIFTNQNFPLPVNILMNCDKIKKRLNIRFSSINKVLLQLCQLSY